MLQGFGIMVLYATWPFTEESNAFAHSVSCESLQYRKRGKQSVVLSEGEESIWVRIAKK